MARHRTYSIEFKRRVAQEFLGGETLYGLTKRHDVCRKLIQIWVAEYEAGAIDEAQAADLLLVDRGLVGEVEGIEAPNEGEASQNGAHGCVFRRKVISDSGGNVITFAVSTGTVRGDLIPRS